MKSIILGKLVTLFLLLSLLPGGNAAADPLKLVAAARQQIGITLHYDPAYRKLAYPNGDVSRDRGVCTDVVIRALRDAYHLDLQRLVHEDMLSHFTSYPSLWRMNQPDANIDHRRVPNLQTYFQRRGWTLAVTTNPRDYRPGDLITVTLPPNLPHIMIISDKHDSDGNHFVIHNIGDGTQEEDLLFRYPHTGHYRPTL